MTKSKRVAVLVYVNLLPTSGAFNTEIGILQRLALIFTTYIGQYNTTVVFAPARYDLPNDPLRKTFLVYIDEAEVPAEKIIAEVLHAAIDRSKPFATKAPNSLQPDDNEGNN